jgi:hypothetical protein
MTEPKARRIGNSPGVVLPKAVTNRLRTADGSDRPTPCDPSFEEKMAKVEDIASRYRSTLQVLAN